jgi:hypothetical protein
MLIVFLSIVLFSGGIAVGIKVSKFARNRRKADALDYIRKFIAGMQNNPNRNNLRTKAHCSINCFI